MQFRKNVRLIWPISVACALLLVGRAHAQEIVRLKLQPAGWSERVGYYTPQRIELSASRPESIRRMPEGITGARYGMLPFRGQAGSAAIAVVLDETPDRSPRL